MPVFTVPVGSPTRLPDVELTNVDLPTFGIAGKSVRVPFTIDSSLPRDYVTTVKMTTSDGQTITRDVRIAPMGRTSDAITWKPDAVGDYTVTLGNPAARRRDDSPDNNTKTAPIAIRQEKLQVLVVESYPRWEYRYLRNALSRDPGVEVSCLLFHPGLSKPGGGFDRLHQRVSPRRSKTSPSSMWFSWGTSAWRTNQLTDEEVCAAQRSGGASGEWAGLHAGSPGAAV